jgi:hypothetical protein
MIVEMKPFGEDIFISHGVASTYDGKPLVGYTPIKKRRILTSQFTYLIPCLRYFWHFGCGAASDARTKGGR